VGGGGATIGWSENLTVIPWVPVLDGTSGSDEIGRFKPALAGARYFAGSFWIRCLNAAAAGPRKAIASRADAEAAPSRAAVNSYVFAPG
jgi:hypothetical protein